MLRWTIALAWMGLSTACGGRTVGDEGYFAGEPLPPPEKKKRPVAAVAPSSVAGSAAPPAGSAPAPVSGPSCDTPPPSGWPKCTADQTNAPCVAAGIGECFLHCDKTAPPRSVPCPQAGPPAR